MFAKWKFPGADVVFTAFLFGMFIPYQAVMIPLQKMTDCRPRLPGGRPKLHPGTHHLWHSDLHPDLPQLLRHGGPNEILEAARVDGAGMIRTYWSIVLPVSMPAFVVTLIWQFTSAWNDFLFALFLTSPRNGPVTYALQELAGGQPRTTPRSWPGCWSPRYRP